MVNVSIGLAYLHYSLKRQAENRQYLIIQAMTFLRRYYDHRLRESASSSVQRQEAHYNLARSYHQLGLTHLAVKYYKLVLQESAASDSDLEEEELAGMRKKMENLAQEAAYNIQNCCLIGGDMAAARAMTQLYLTL